MIVAVLAFAAVLAPISPAQTSPAQVQTGVQADAAAPQAPSASNTGAAPAATAEAERPRMICTNVQVTGTRFPIRRCHSAKQTEAERADSQEMLRQMQGARTPPVG